MRSHFKILFYIKKQEPLRNGDLPIMCRITINRSSCSFSTHLSVRRGCWDLTQKRVAGRGKEAQRINKHLDEIYYLLYDAYMTVLHSTTTPTPQRVREVYRNDFANQMGVVAYFERHNRTFEKLVGVSRSRSTLYKYKYVCQHLRNYIYKRYMKHDLPMNSVNRDFIGEFHGWLIKDRECCANSAWLYMIALKHIFACAVNDGLILSSPFAGYKLHQQVVRKNFLDREELRCIMAYKPTSPMQGSVLDAFVFSCFTGLSFVDIKKLRMCDVHVAGQRRWIAVFRAKTGCAVDVPLLRIPYYIIMKYSRGDDKPIFSIPSNCWCNQIIRRVATSLGINRAITFHSARHTFATTMTLNNGVPMEIVSHMLGHADIKTTQIYARVQNSSVITQMQRVSKTMDTYFETQLSNMASSRPTATTA